MTFDSQHSDSQRTDSELSGSHLAADGQRPDPKRPVDPTLAAALTGPTLVHALVFLAFGLTTVFWQQPTLGVITVMLGLYMLGYAGASYLTAQTLRSVGDASTAQAFTSIALVQAAGGVLAFVAPRGEFWLTLIAACVLGLTGVLKLLAGMRTKASNPAARDWQLEGAIVTLSAAALPVVSEIGDKAIMGTAGGGALVAGIFLAVGAFSLMSLHQKTI
ncbi:MAG TPA: hypothetical protein H9821_01605 [Candidatus Rothia avicola]|uniref:Uncharacterized protein n=1 Tax=Candidatus Rothia avicola TaxID=2840478 RepID=A0A9D1ZRV3_9MICC|nr:hypothetical protein [Candidatus Rothia avicola]